MKKLLPALLALAMTAFVLTACAAGTDGSTAAEPISAEAGRTEDSSDAAGAESEESSSASGPLRIGSLKGPTSIGLVSLMDKASTGDAKGSYEFIMVTAPDDLLAKMVSGDLDIALLPANMASILYNKTEGGIRVIDINTLGVLYVVSADDSIRTIGDLKGRTIYMTGKGATPDYVFRYLLTANGLAADDVTLEYKSEATEVAALLKEQPDAIALLPQPFATVAREQNDALKLVLHLSKEWEAVRKDEGGSLVTGVTAVRSEVLDERSGQVITFMEEHKASAEYAGSDVAGAAKLVAEAGIIEKASTAEKAIPDCSITYQDGALMKKMLEGYLKVLYDQDPATVGGKLPDDGFYYIAE